MTTAYHDPVLKSRKRTRPVYRWPLIVRAVALFRFRADAGIGDTLSRLFAFMGGRQFKAFTKWLGLECGCDQRQHFLNIWFPYRRE